MTFQLQVLPPRFPSLTIVVPVFNCLQRQGADVLQRTLRSIEISLDYFLQHYPYAEQVAYELVVVDDASSDRTVEWLQAWSQPKPYYRLECQPDNLGPSVARNVGVRKASGQIIFFCDSDDLYYETHLFYAFLAMNQPIPATDATAPPRYPGVVKTRIKFQDDLHPIWKSTLENYLPINLCVRREVHEFLEGFPEGELFRRYRNEDVIYYNLWSYFFPVTWLNLETVEHVRYPGNYFAKQLPKFQVAPDAYTEKLTPEEEKAYATTYEIGRDKLVYLINKFQANPPVI